MSVSVELKDRFYSEMDIVVKKEAQDGKFLIRAYELNSAFLTKSYDTETERDAAFDKLKNSIAKFWLADFNSI